MRRIAIIGAGAAGCFCASLLREMAPDAQVTLFEAGAKPMAKLAITGGGRCNLTNSFAGIRSLQEAYPRGERLMKRALKAFSQEDIREWFHARGVKTVLQPDECVFPVSQDAMDIVRCLQRSMAGAELRLNSPVTRVQLPEEGSLEGASAFFIASSGESSSEAFDTVVVTTGGAPKGLPFLAGLELEMVPPVPSLFTFTIQDPALRERMGLVVSAQLSIPGTAFRSQGPLLITDWGLSGPATLKLSSYAARYLADNNYHAPLLVNWLPEENARELLQSLAQAHPQKLVTSAHPEALPARLWEMLVARAGLREGLRWAEMGAKGMNKLSAVLSQDEYRIEGKSRFREEFVTAGGVALNNLNLNTLESKRYPGLYFAGEVLDVDAITGGFNLQAAWSTAYLVAKAICL